MKLAVNRLAHLMCAMACGRSPVEDVEQRPAAAALHALQHDKLPVYWRAKVSSEDGGVEGDAREQIIKT